MENLVKNLQCYLILLQPPKKTTEMAPSVSSFQLMHLAALLAGVYLLSKKLENMAMTHEAWDARSVTKLRALLSFCSQIIEELCCFSFVESFLIRMPDFPKSEGDEVCVFFQPFTGDDSISKQHPSEFSVINTSFSSPGLKRKVSVGSKKTLRVFLEEKIRGDVMLLRVEALANVSTLLRCLSSSSSLSSGNTPLCCR